MHLTILDERSVNFNPSLYSTPQKTNLQPEPPITPIKQPTFNLEQQPSTSSCSDQATPTNKDEQSSSIHSEAPTIIDQNRASTSLKFDQTTSTSREDKSSLTYSEQTTVVDKDRPSASTSSDQQTPSRYSIQPEEKSKGHGLDRSQGQNIPVIAVEGQVQELDDQGRSVESKDTVDSGDTTDNMSGGRYGGGKMDEVSEFQQVSVQSGQFNIVQLCLCVISCVSLRSKLSLE